MELDDVKLLPAGNLRDLLHRLIYKHANFPDSWMQQLRQLLQCIRRYIPPEPAAADKARIVRLKAVHDTDVLL